MTEAEQKVAKQLTNDQLREFKAFADRASHDQSFVRALGSESRDAQDLSSRLSTATSRIQSTQSSYAERQAVAERLSTAYESGETLSIDLAQLPANSEFMQRYQRLAAEYGSESLALQAAMASELATRALPPTRNAAPGAALPATFGDVREGRDETIQDPVFSPDRIATADQVNDRAAAPKVSLNGLQPVLASPELDGVRAEVSSRAAAAASSPTAAETFDARNEISRNPDGTVSTRRSQLAVNARQLRDDAANLAANAEEVITGARENARRKAEASRARQAESPRTQGISATPDVPTMRPRDGSRKNR